MLLKQTSDQLQAGHENNSICKSRRLIMAARGGAARAAHPVTSIALECDGEPTQDNIFARKEKPPPGSEGLSREER
jgi:hypothetical protein